eukprot:Opistho-2@46666
MARACLGMNLRLIVDGCVLVCYSCELWFISLSVSLFFFQVTHSYLAACGAVRDSVRVIPCFSRLFIACVIKLRIVFFILALCLLSSFPLGVPTVSFGAARTVVVCCLLLFMCRGLRQFNLRPSK